MQFDMQLEALREYRPVVEEPDDFEEYWARVLAEATALLLVYGRGFDGVRLPAMPVVGLDELFAPEPTGGRAAQPAPDSASFSAPCRSPA